MPPWKESSEAMLRILLGALRAIMSRAASCESWKTLVRFTWRTVIQSSRGNSSAAWRRMVPALLTRISIWPKVSRVWVMRCRGPSVEERSAEKAADLEPVAEIAAAVSVAGRRLPWQATDAPACASAVAMAAPRPEAEPVTRATLPSRRKVSRTFVMMLLTILPVGMAGKCVFRLTMFSLLPYVERWNCAFLLAPKEILI